VEVVLSLYSVAALFGACLKERNPEVWDLPQIFWVISGQIRMQYKSPLLQSLQSNLRLQHMSRRTEDAYIYWTKRFVRFCGLRHPSELGVTEVRRFLSHLVVERKLSAATQQQALGALLFLYRKVLGQPLEALGRLPRGRVPTTLPVVLTPDEVARVVGSLPGVHRLVALLMYGSGLRVTECLMLRVKDLDLERGELNVRRGKGGKDRVTVIPETLREPLREHLGRSVRCTFGTWLPARDGWRCRAAWMPSIRRQGRRGRGSGCFRLDGGTGMRRVAGFSGTISMNRPSNEP
jgi:integrase